MSSEICPKCKHHRQDHKGIEGYCSKCKCRWPRYIEVRIDSVDDFQKIGNHFAKTGQPSVPQEEDISEEIILTWCPQCDIKGDKGKFCVHCGTKLTVFNKYL